jgi:hypothetical protein
MNPQSFPPINSPILLPNDPTVFPVYPNLTITKRICKAKIAVMRYIPFTSASINVLLYDENDIVIDTRGFVLDLPEFLDWGNDDKFLVNWVKQKLTK